MPAPLANPGAHGPSCRHPVFAVSQPTAPDERRELFGRKATGQAPRVRRAEQSSAGTPSSPCPSQPRLTATPFVRPALRAGTPSSPCPSRPRLTATPFVRRPPRVRRALFSGPHMTGATVRPIKPARATLSISSPPHQRSSTTAIRVPKLTENDKNLPFHHLIPVQQGTNETVPIDRFPKSQFDPVAQMQRSRAASALRRRNKL